MKTASLHIRIPEDIRKKLEKDVTDLRKHLGYKITLSEYVLKLLRNALS